MHLNRTKSCRSSDFDTLSSLMYINPTNNALQFVDSAAIDVGTSASKRVAERHAAFGARVVGK